MESSLDNVSYLSLGRFPEVLNFFHKPEREREKETRNGKMRGRYNVHKMEGYTYSNFSLLISNDKK